MTHREEAAELLKQALQDTEDDLFYRIKIESPDGRTHYLALLDCLSILTDKIKAKLDDTTIRRD